MVAVVFCHKYLHEYSCSRIIDEKSSVQLLDCFPFPFCPGLSICLSFRLRGLPSYPSYYIGVLWGVGGASNWDQDGSDRRFATFLETYLAICIGRTTDTQTSVPASLCLELRKTK